MLAAIYKGHSYVVWKLWYPLFTYLARNSPVIFLNYGFADDGTAGKAPALKEQDEPDRACIQLYDHVVGAVGLDGLSVLEVSCGHGGGAAYMARYMKPKSMHGMDRNARAIKFCKRRYQVEGLTFSRGHAQTLEFADDAFDAVVNIEASHCYPDVPRFFREVARVLRPGGHFLYADFRRSNPDRAVLHGQVKESGLEVTRCEDISRYVVRGMQLNTPRYIELSRQFLPRLMRKPVMSFAGVKGSGIYNRLESGETVYMCYVLRKPMPP